VGKCHIHLVVPRLVNGSEMFTKFLDERDEDQADEGVGEVVFLDDILDILD
jgi:hypothetical protein